MAKEEVEPKEEAEVEVEVGFFLCNMFLLIINFIALVI